MPGLIAAVATLGCFAALMDPPLHSLGQVDGEVVTVRPGRGRFSPDTVGVTVRLSGGTLVYVSMDRLIAARVREGEAVTVLRNRTLYGRVIYTSAYPSRYMPASPGARPDAGGAASGEPDDASGEPVPVGRG